VAVNSMQSPCLSTGYLKSNLQSPHHPSGQKKPKKHWAGYTNLQVQASTFFHVAWHFEDKAAGPATSRRCASGQEAHMVQEVPVSASSDQHVLL
jgi:hypothetical protein